MLLLIPLFVSPFFFYLFMSYLASTSIRFVSPFLRSFVASSVSKPMMTSLRSFSTGIFGLKFSAIEKSDSAEEKSEDIQMTDECAKVVLFI